MSKHNSKRQRVIELSKIGISKGNAARILVDEKYCKNFEAARSYIRYLTGAMGKASSKDPIEWNGHKKTVSSAKIFLFDIETSVIIAAIFRAGKQYIQPQHILKDWNLLCWSGKWLFQDKTVGAVVTPEEAVNGDDRRIVQSLWHVFNEADFLVAHNGKRFDVRRANSRFVYYGMPPPAPYILIDTLQASYKEFDHTFHKQDWIAKMLKLPEKFKTDFDLWKNCEKGDPDSLKFMFDYCGQDVHGLEEVYIKYRPWIRSHPNIAIFESGEKLRCRACGSDRLELAGSYLTPVNKYDAYRCQEEDCRSFTRSRFGMHPKDRRRLGGAVTR